MAEPWGDGWRPRGAAGWPWRPDQTMERHQDTAPTPKVSLPLLEPGTALPHQSHPTTSLVLTNPSLSQRVNRDHGHSLQIFLGMLWFCGEREEGDEHFQGSAEPILGQVKDNSSLGAVKHQGLSRAVKTQNLFLVLLLLLASSCAGGGLDWILANILFLKEWSGIGPGCPGQWGSPHSWRHSKTVWMWHLGTWFSRPGGVGVTV